VSAEVIHDPRALARSRHTSTFAHMGEVYLYHDLYGFILKMSPDILEFLQAFRSPTDPEKVCSKFGNAFGEQTPESFVGIFQQFKCLVTPGDDELDGLWEMVGVPGPWNVWRLEEDGGLTFFTAWGDRPVSTHRLSPAEAAIWKRMDGETRLATLGDEFGKPEVAALVQRLAHHDLQALKLSGVGLSFFKGRQHMQPPYLTSTMPYAPYDPDTDPVPVPLGDLPTPETYYRNDIADADAQFDHQETTLSHLFRDPHPVLAGRRYGDALVAGLAARGLIADGPLRVLEVGAGLGKVARAVIESLQAAGHEVSYDILELSPTLAARQREELAGLPVTVHLGEALADPWPGSDYDLLVSNEMIGDLPAARLTHAEARLADETLEGDAFQAHLASLGPAGEVAARYTIPIGDAPDPFYVNVGAIRFVERAFEALRSGGAAFISEFGEMGRWPVLSTQLDHPELSIHFGHLMTVAKAVGFEADFAFVMDLIDMDRDVRGLATTRSYFRALTAMLAESGVTLEKRAYTDTMVADLLRGAIDAERIGDLRYDKIEDRLMGLVPHEFKALLLKKP
jgi:SAM-dependent methyltransferase